MNQKLESRFERLIRRISNWRSIVFMVVLLAPFYLSADETNSPFAVVFIDSKTEKTLGAFPFNRSIIAKGLNEIKRYQPKGVVLKFFYDLPKDPQDDKALADSLEGMPVLLQARLNDSNEKSNILPEQFYLKVASPKETRLLSGNSGWIPLPLFSAKAHDVGFVDVSTPDKIPLLEKYQGKFVKSLYLCAIELAFGEKAEITPGQHFKIHGKTIPFDEQSQIKISFPATDKMNYIPFHDLLSGHVKAEQLKDKVVILGYDGENAKMDAFRTSIGQIKAHRFFFYGLESLVEQIQKP